MQDKILLVDDEPAILEGYKRLLYRNFAVDTAPSGESGLASLHVAGPFSVVISDMRMPGMNGAEFLAAVRQKAPNTVRMLLTGHADIEETIDAINRGKIFRFLSKPCTKEVLVEAINEGISQFHAAETERELAERAKIAGRSDAEKEAEQEQRADNYEGLAGLPGAPDAKKYLQRLFGTDAHAFVVLFKLTFFRTVAERYGEEAAAEYLLSAVKFLRDEFSRSDPLFQWNRDVLMAVVRRQVSPGAVRMELARLLSDNTQQIIEYNGREIMLSFSITFDLLSIAQFTSQDEMFEAFNAKLTGRL